MPPESVLLYVGDREQLPPVSGVWGPDLTRPTAALTKVHRQALGNPVLRIATEVRSGRPFHSVWSPKDVGSVTFRRAPFESRLDFLPEIVQWIVDRRLSGRDATLIVYTNATRQALNRAVRRALGLDVKAVVPGDLLLVRANNHAVGIMNGEVLTVTETRPLPNNGWGIRVAGRDGEFFVNANLIGSPHTDFREWVRDNLLRDDEWRSRVLRGDAPPQEDSSVSWLHVDYGQVLTCHAAQGSAWDEVGIFWERACWGLLKNEPETARRWMYTALTRARLKAAVWYA